ncbi:MAG: hypothetical protein ACREVN_13175, partial [Gammaproteobacteria bacterium]
MIAAIMYPHISTSAAPDALGRARALVREHARDRADDVAERASDLSATVETLGADPLIVTAATLYPLLDRRLVDEPAIEGEFGPEIACLTR